MGWSAEQEQFFITGLQQEIKSSLKSALKEAFQAGTVDGCS